MRCNLGRALWLAAFGIVMIGSRASADLVYTINPAQSYLTLEVYDGGSPLSGGYQVTESQVGPGGLGSSDTTSLSGTLNASVGGGSISFGGGSSLEFAYQPEPLLPNASGGNASGPGTPSPAQYGLTVQPDNVLGASGYIALSGAAGDITNYSGPSGLTLVNGTTSSFHATNQNFVLTAAGLAFWLNVPGLGVDYGTEVLAPPAVSVQNGVDAYGFSTYSTGTVTTLAGITSITLPVFADVHVDVYIGPTSYIPLDVVMTGQIVASSVASPVPEPSTLVLACVGVVGSLLVFNARRRPRNA